MTEIVKISNEYFEEINTLRKYFHENPELSNKEFNTTKIITEKLLEYGLEIENIGLKTGVSAILKGKYPGKTVIIREDIDALPMQENTGLDYSSKINGVCHSCGHDLHIATSLLCAKVLKNFKDELHGNIRFLFQPAEETAEGAREMIKCGVMNLSPKADCIIGVHTSPDIPVGMVGIKKGPANASCDTFKIKVFGTGGHGAHPYRCVDPIVIASYLVTQLQTIVSRETQAVYPAVITIGMIHGGTAPNIIPSEVELQGNIRTFNEKEREKILNSVERISKGVAESMRGHAEVEIMRGIPVLLNDNEIADILIKAVSKSLGKDKIFNIELPSPGSDDFACFLEFCPGMQFRIGTANDDPNSRCGLHSPKNIFDSRGFLAGAIAMSQYVIEYLNNK
ncbi:MULTISPECIES: M20 family metallopeptidase [Fusobacterium]|uniref:M20 metallopeptidase family protein n=1 Tax=Fusobacterium TaxID=848 RepID=UPI001476E8F3|nr:MULTISPECIES: M20 family metallopeptidase [Fusobacterium]NME35266.1 amidohydrolase [Fusobacterium sp. FSA-380-WT-3A]